MQNIAKKAAATFRTELHELRKTSASRRYLAGVPLPTLMLESGHESLAVTQDYLADVRKPGAAKKAVADADFVPKPKVIKRPRTATDLFLSCPNGDDVAATPLQSNTHCPCVTDRLLPTVPPVKSPLIWEFKLPPFKAAIRAMGGALSTR